MALERENGELRQANEILRSASAYTCPGKARPPIFRRFGLRELSPNRTPAMTDERMALLDLVEKGTDADLVRDMLAFAADRILEAEAEVAAGAAKGARSPLREVYRNGYRERDCDTRAGRIELAILRLRKGSCFPSFLEPRLPA